MKKMIILGTYVVLIAAALTSCKKTDMTSESETPASTTSAHRPIQIGTDTEDRPKLVKGNLKNSEKEAIELATVSINSPDSTELADTISGYTGAFEMGSYTGGTYYLKIVASGYETKYVGLNIPFDAQSVYDVGEIILTEE